MISGYPVHQYFRKLPSGCRFPKALSRFASSMVAEIPGMPDLITIFEMLKDSFIQDNDVYLILVRFWSEFNSELNW